MNETLVRAGLEVLKYWSAAKTAQLAAAEPTHRLSSSDTELDRVLYDFYYSVTAFYRKNFKRFADIIHWYSDRNMYTEQNNTG